MKNLIKFIVFAIVFVILCHNIFKVLWLQSDAILEFYDEPKNSLDVIYIGGSTVGAEFNASLAYKEYGFATGMLTSGDQPFTATKHLIKEANKYQNPNIYVVDLSAVVDDFDYNFKSQWVRSVVDYMKFSKNRIDAIDYMLWYADVPLSDHINYYFSFLLYHNSWKSINWQRFNKNTLKGYWFFTSIFRKDNKYTEYIWPTGTHELNGINEYVLLDLINYIKMENLNVLFVIPKRNFLDIDCQKLNYSSYIIESNGLNVINFNNQTDFNPDEKTDFYDHQHLNFLGATKYTMYLSKYLKETYNLKDHRGEKKYHSWDAVYEKFMNIFEPQVSYKFTNVAL